MAKTDVYGRPANAVLHHDRLEFLEDIVPKTSTLRQVKEQAAATRAKLRGETKDAGNAEDSVPNGKRQKTLSNGSDSSPAGRGHKVNGGGSSGTNALEMSSMLVADEDPSAQLELEMRQAGQGQGSAPGHDADVDMTGTG
jgi:DNA polymerase epsilon subunit 4